MNIGILLALAVGLIWSFNNVVHKVMASKLINNPRVMLMLYGFVIFIVAAVVALFSSGLIPLKEWWMIGIAGIINAFGVWIYFIAMQRYEASRVVPLYAIGSVMIILASAFFLGEVFGFKTYLGIGIILLGTLVLTTKKKFFSAFSSRLLWLMVLSGMVFTFSALVIKYLLSFYSFTQVFSNIGLVEGIIAIGIAMAYFKNIRKSISVVNKRYLIYSSINEMITVLGSFTYTIALSFWYLSLTETIASLQFMFIFFWSLIISRFKPSLYLEEINRRIIFQKAIAIVLILIGVYLI